MHLAVQSRVDGAGGTLWTRSGAAWTQRRLAMICGSGLPGGKIQWNVGYLEWPLTSTSRYEAWGIDASHVIEHDWGDYIKVRDVSPSLFVGRFVAVGYVTKENDAPAPSAPDAGFVKYVSFGDPEE